MTTTRAIITLGIACMLFGGFMLAQRATDPAPKRAETVRHR